MLILFVSCSDSANRAELSDFLGSYESKIFPISAGSANYMICAVASNSYRIAICGPIRADYSFGSASGDIDVSHVKFNERTLSLGDRFISFIPSESAEPIIVAMGDEIPIIKKEDWANYCEKVIKEYINKRNIEQGGASSLINAALCENL